MALEIFRGKDLDTIMGRGYVPTGRPAILAIDHTPSDAELERVVKDVNPNPGAYALAVYQGTTTDTNIGMMRIIGEINFLDRIGQRPGDFYVVLLLVRRPAPEPRGSSR